MSHTMPTTRCCRQHRADHAPWEARPQITAVSAAVHPRYALINLLVAGREFSGLALKGMLARGI
jgi:hypothetical protein